ncbi:MAG: hypothetical protein M1541_14790 [Acidobacteria bacterium]|nr:hypothetical protein [Acidobacteriota bacterium]
MKLFIIALSLALSAFAAAPLKQEAPKADPPKQAAPAPPKLENVKPVSTEYLTLMQSLLLQGQQQQKALQEAVQKAAAKLEATICQEAKIDSDCKVDWQNSQVGKLAKDPPKPEAKK